NRASGTPPVLSIEVRCSPKGNATIELQMNPPAAGAPSKHQIGQRWNKFALLLASVALSVSVFLVLDWGRTALIRRSSPTAGKRSCGIRDPVRHHAFKPNCSSIYPWGGDSYEFVTNSLGFRDEKMRDVPLADARPRILILG